MSWENKKDTKPTRENESDNIIALLGNQINFSDNLIKLMDRELECAKSLRFPSLQALVDAGIDPKVIVIHDTLARSEAHPAQLRRHFPDTMLAVSGGDTELVARLNMDHVGTPISLLQMDAQIDVWFSVLRLILSGHPYIPVTACPASNARRPVAPQENGETYLTPREQEILPLIAQGAQNKTIAGQLGLSIHTVKLHSHNIFAKLGVSNRTGAANWYLSQMARGARQNARTGSR